MEELLEGYRLQMQGRREEAERLYRGVLAGDADNVHALNLLGIICLESARAAEAVQLISRALSQAPDDAEALANLGLALKDVGRPEEAAQCLSKSLLLKPRNPVALNNLGNVLCGLRRDEEAVASFRAALQQDPGYVACLVNLAAALAGQGRLPGAVAAATRAVELDPLSPDARRGLGDVLLKQSRHEEAADQFRRAMALRSGFVDAMVGLSAALKEIGDLGSAEQVLRDAIAREPGNAPAHNSLGVFLEQKGNNADAARHFRLAIESAPRYANPYYQLAQLKGTVLTPEEVAAIRTFFSDETITDEQRAPLAFAMACMLERAGEYDESFRHLAIGQAIKAAESPYDHDKVIDYYGRIEAAYAAPIDPAEEPAAAASPRPVFVLGMPRSGTSLIEQILASHPDIEGAGEMSLMEDTINEAARVAGKPFPGCASHLSRAQRVELGEFYLSRLRKRATGARHIVDKTPMNYQYVGFIASILAGARIIHARRDPLDNCLSIFKLPFESAHSYAHDLKSLGLHYGRYARLMAHWEKVAPGRMISVQYEVLVADLEAQCRRMLEFLALPFDPAVLDYHRNRRLVKTPSASQVRRPIYQDSVAAWRRYEGHLRPLAAALAAEGGSSGSLREGHSL